MSTLIERAAQMIAALGDVQHGLVELGKERDEWKEKYHRLKDGLCQDCYEQLIEKDAPEKPYLRELPSGDFEKVFPEGWPIPPGPKRPNVVRRRDA